MFVKMQQLKFSKINYTRKKILLEVSFYQAKLELIRHSFRRIYATRNMTIFLRFFRELTIRYLRVVKFAFAKVGIGMGR